MAAAKSFYVTTPIYYVNDLPHIGHIYTTIVTDVVARYHRLAGVETRFLTGTDEHGQKIERAAAKEGIAPIALADRVVARYHQLKDKLGFSYDDFLRTTEERHHRTVAELVRRIDAAGDLYTAKHEGWYCAGCENFYPEKELAPGNLCPVHGTAVEWTSEENVFFRLSRFQQPLLDWYERCPEAVRPATRLNEVRSFVEAGLKDLSVSRASVTWGIPFPGRPGQTIYVWLDALTNYISALGFGREGEDDLYRHFWDREGAERLHMVGKDILRFHAVYWPAFLLSAGLPLPHVWAHGWWLRDGRKMSKSVGNVVRPDELIERFGADALRFFVLREMVFGQDAQFSDEAFIDRFNSDLANDLGNTVSRAVTLSRSAFGGKTPPTPCDDNALLTSARQVVADYRAAMDEFAFHRALESLWKLVAETNQYIVSREPWKLIKTEGPSEKLSHILYNALEATRIVATALLPVMPREAPKVLAALGIEAVPQSLDALAWGGLPTDAPLPEPRPIFPRIDKKAYLETHMELVPDPPPAAPAAPESAASATPATSAASADVPPLDRPLVTIDRFGDLDLRVGTVRAAEAVPKSKKLLKLTVDIGLETRTVVAGIALAYAPDDLIGKQVVIVANLQPATLMGVESQGMVLAASVDGKPVVLHPGAPVPEGTRVK